MSAAKHTSGPWIVEEVDGFLEVCNEETLYTVARVFRHKANARLIAAAPTTAEKAMAFTDIVERFMRSDHPPGVTPATEAEVAEAMYELRAHIAQATGSAS